jgi:phenylacetate-coenzyme A ligase PaaK-like adenylate-forming protein
MEDIWGAVIHDIYGSTQLNLNYAITCKYGAVPDGQFGTYHLADYFALVEVLDKDTDQPVAYGEWGEPVVTTFSRQAMAAAGSVRLRPDLKSAVGGRHRIPLRRHD